MPKVEEGKGPIREKKESLGVTSNCLEDGYVKPTATSSKTIVKTSEGGKSNNFNS
jgi:hypothetical protein